MMLRGILSFLFPSVRALYRLRDEVNTLRDYMGGSAYPGDIDGRDVVSYVENLHADACTYRDALLKAEDRLSHIRTSDHVRWEETQRAVRRWQEERGTPVVWPKHSDLCVWLLHRLEALEVVPSLASLRRDSKKRWWATTQTNVAYEGDRNLIRLLHTIRVREHATRKEQHHAR